MPLDMCDAWFIPTLELFPTDWVQAQGCHADDGPATYMYLYGLLIAGGVECGPPPQWAVQVPGLKSHYLPR